MRKKTILRIVAALGMFAIVALSLNPPWRGYATSVDGKKSQPKDFIRMKQVNLQEMYIGHRSLFSPPEYVHYLMSRGPASKGKMESYMGNTPVFGSPRIDTGRLLAEFLGIAALTTLLMLLISLCESVERANPQDESQHQLA